MRRLPPLCVAIAAFILLSEQAAAGFNTNEALALHITEVQSTIGCSPVGLTRNTLQETVYVLSGSEGPFFFVYLISCNGAENPGTAGLECGIQYPGGFSATGGFSPINVFSWNLCADSQAPVGWPNSEGSNLLSWLPINCQQNRSEPADPGSVIGIAGYFYLAAYAPAPMTITPRFDTGQSRVFRCDASVVDLIDHVPSRWGQAGFGGVGGYNPCLQGVVPTRQVTWARLKAFLP